MLDTGTITSIVLIILGTVGFYFLSSKVLLKQPPMILNILKVVFIGFIVLVAYMNYNTVQSKIELTQAVKERDMVVRERLEQVRDAQVEYKKVRGEYAASFDQLIDFLKNDSLIQVKAIGEVPDSLLGREAEALAMGIITRDTTKIPVRTLLFTENFDQVVDSMMYVPYSGGKQFVVRAGEIEKGMVKVKVFEVVSYFSDIYRGLKTDNEGYDLTDSLMIGSMNEPTTNGNWN